MLRSVPGQKHPAVVSSGEDFVTNKMQPDDFWGRHSFIKTAIYGLLYVRPQFFQSVGFRVDAFSQSRSGVTSINLILSNLKDDLVQLTPGRLCGRPFHGAMLHGY